MKSIKSLLLIAAAMFTTASYAQVDKTFSFIDKDGKEIPSGTVWTANTVEDDPFGEGEMVVDEVYVKNNTNERQGVGAFVNIKKIDVPENCKSGITGGMTRTDAGTLKAGQVKELKSEWVPKSDGVCEVYVKLEYYNINTNKWGIESFERVDDEDLDNPMPYIIIHFVKGATAINGVKDGQNVEVTGIYDATGKQIQTTQKGLNIVKLSNGKTVKIVK